MSLAEIANAGLRFVLELCALVALAYWGFNASETIVEWLLGLGAPLAFALVWGALVAPKAPYRLEDPARLLLEVLAFTAPIGALVDADEALLGLAFAIGVLANLVLMQLLGQRLDSGI